MNSMILVHAKIHNDHSMKYEDFIQNKNVEPTLINMRYVHEVTPFNENQINNYAFNYFEFLHGSKSTLWLDYINTVHVVETVEEIYAMLNGTK